MSDPRGTSQAIDAGDGRASGVVALRLVAVSVSLGGQTVLQQVSVQVPAGQVLAVLGPNGAGKTTLLRACLGLVPTDGGSIHVLGQPLATVMGRARARLVAYVPQRSDLVSPVTAWDVVAMGRYPHLGAMGTMSIGDRAAIERALRMTDVWQLRHRISSTLSGGERQRVLLARALATEAPVVLLDEPATGLDLAHALDTYAVIRELARAGKAVVMVLHRVDDALQWADHALLLACGLPMAQGVVSDVVTPANVERVYGVRMRPGDGYAFSRVPSGGGGSGAP